MDLGGVWYASSNELRCDRDVVLVAISCGPAYALHSSHLKSLQLRFARGYPVGSLASPNSRWPLEKGGGSGDAVAASAAV